jgi:hypothetical protein
MIPHNERGAMRVNEEQINQELTELVQCATPPDPDVDLAQFLRGKRVVVVGPAQTLLGTRSGARIDAYDVVIRFNSAIHFMPFSDQLRADIGTRTDILYCNHKVIYDIVARQGMVASLRFLARRAKAIVAPLISSTHKSSAMHPHGISRAQFATRCQAAGIKYLICTNNNLSYQRNGAPTPCCAAHSRTSMLEFEQFLSNQGVAAKFRMLYATTALFNQWINGCVGRTGAIAIFDLLLHDIEQLYVTGMTFYHKGGHLFQPGLGELHPLLGPDGLILSGPERHNSYLELEVMKLLATHMPHKLQVDEPLNTLLAENDSTTLS